MDEIEKIKKDGAFTALIASFEEGCDKIREDWEILYLEDWDEIRVKTLKAINRLDLIVAAIKELEPVESEESKPEETEESKPEGTEESKPEGTEEEGE